MMNNIKIDNFLIKDITWTLKNFSIKIKEWEAIPIWDRNPDQDPYKQAAHAMLIAAKIGFGDCYPIDTFIERVKDGSFIDDDGNGSWVDFEGNKISSIRCDTEWLKNNKPENAKFIMWYNK